MAWFKVDDGFHSSRKVLSIPRRGRYAAVGVWSLAGSWCADELTDGFVPDYMITEWGVPKSAPDALVAAGLWMRERDGYAFHNWREYQPSKADVDAERAASRARMKELRAKRKGQKLRDPAPEGEVFGRTVENGSENVRNPDPTRPDPTLITTSNEVVPAPKKRATRIPEGWTPSEASIDKLRTERPDLDTHAEHPNFVDYWTSAPGARGTKADWDATWRIWMRKQGTPATVRVGAPAGKPTAGQRARTIADELRKEGL